MFVRRQDWACEACFNIYPLYDAIVLYCIDMLMLDPNVLRDSYVRTPLFPTLPCIVMLTLFTVAQVHVNAIMWRVVYRELRALTNDSALNLNPMEICDIYEHVWNVGTLLQSDECLSILDDGYRSCKKLTERECRISTDSSRSTQFR